MNTRTICDCGHVAIATGCTTGYGTDADGKTWCFACCGERDRDSMMQRGDSRLLPLYLQKSGSGWKVQNWCGTLTFSVNHLSKGNHNIAGSRYDVRFAGPDGFMWHGVQYGEWTQVCHAKRTIERAS